MNERDKARPVFGEIMAHGPQPPRARTERPDFAEAEFVTLEPEAPAATPRFGTRGAATGMDFLTTPPTEPKKTRRNGGALFWASGLTMVVLAFWVSGGHALVRQAVLAIPVETIHPLQIAGVESRIERHNGRDVLFVTGAAENRGTTPRALPPIEIAVIATDGAVTRYNLGTNGTELTPGGRYSFSSRLEPPGNGVKTVAVTFQEVSH